MTVLHSVPLDLSYEELRTDYHVPPEAVNEILGHIEQESERTSNDAHLRNEFPDSVSNYVSKDKDTFMIKI